MFDAILSSTITLISVALAAAAITIDGAGRLRVKHARLWIQLRWLALTACAFFVAVMTLCCVGLYGTSSQSQYRPDLPSTAAVLFLFAGLLVATFMASWVTLRALRPETISGQMVVDANRRADDAADRDEAAAIVKDVAQDLKNLCGDAIDRSDNDAFEHFCEAFGRLHSRDVASLSELGELFRTLGTDRRKLRLCAKTMGQVLAGLTIERRRDALRIARDLMVHYLNVERPSRSVVEDLVESLLLPTTEALGTRELDLLLPLAEELRRSEGDARALDHAEPVADFLVKRLVQQTTQTNVERVVHVLPASMLREELFVAVVRAVARKQDAIGPVLFDLLRLGREEFTPLADHVAGADKALAEPYRWLYRHHPGGISPVRRALRKELAKRHDDVHEISLLEFGALQAAVATHFDLIGDDSPAPEYRAQSTRWLADQAIVGNPLEGPGFMRSGIGLSREACLEHLRGAVDRVQSELSNRFPSRMAQAESAPLGDRLAPLQLPREICRSILIMSVECALVDDLARKSATWRGVQLGLSLVQGRGLLEAPHIIRYVEEAAARAWSLVSALEQDEATPPGAGNAGRWAVEALATWWQASTVLMSAGSTEPPNPADVTLVRPEDDLRRVLEAVVPSSSGLLLERLRRMAIAPAGSDGRLRLEVRLILDVERQRLGYRGRPARFLSRTIAQAPPEAGYLQLALDLGRRFPDFAVELAHTLHELQTRDQSRFSELETVLTALGDPPSNLIRSWLLSFAAPTSARRLEQQFGETPRPALADWIAVGALFPSGPSIDLDRFAAAVHRLEPGERELRWALAVVFAHLASHPDPGVARRVFDRKFRYAIRHIAEDDEARALAMTRAYRRAGRFDRGTPAPNGRRPRIEAGAQRG